MSAADRRFEAHLDECERCRLQPFNLCGPGASLLAASALAAGERPKPNPKIVTLCGSTKFRRAFELATYRLSMEGWAVFSVASFGRTPDVAGEMRDAMSEDAKRALDELHLRKVAMSSRVHVLNVGGYIGQSTASEIAHAVKLGIPITFVEEAAGRAWLRARHPEAA